MSAFKQCQALTQTRKQCHRESSDNGNICGVHKKFKQRGGQLQLISVPSERRSVRDLVEYQSHFLDFVNKMEIISLKEEIAKQKTEISLLRLRLNVAHRAISDLIKTNTYST